MHEAQKAHEPTMTLALNAEHDSNRPTFVSRREGARRIGISHRTLESLSGTGRGPREYRIGKRVLLDISELESWVRNSGRTA